MRSPNGVFIESIVPGSLADAAGLRSGDFLLKVNSFPVRDVIDFMFHKDSDELDLEYKRKEAKHKVSIISGDSFGNSPNLGIIFRPFKVKTCRNNCIFCFVSQLPKGLRRTLYVKDEDYRLSFLYGNYTTLSNITEEERKRIVQQRLSPLYISVHSTNRNLRNKMLGNPKAPDIMKELKFFSSHKIRMHIQIVLCPGFNDGKELKSTVLDIYKFYPYISSIAVVPVGLTKHRRMQLDHITADDALRAIDTVESFQKRFRKKHGESVIYCADEMYIKAGRPFPLLSDYGELPQLENGVGMVPLFTSQAKRIRITKPVQKNKKFLAITGISFYPFLKKFISRIREKEQIVIDLLPVENKFFGSSVTVTGLLTGRDIITTLHDNTDSYDILIIPEVVLKDGEHLFLDNISLSNLEEATGLKVAITDGTPQGFIDTLTFAEGGRVI